MNTNWNHTLYFMRLGDCGRPVLAAKVAPKRVAVAAEYGIEEWIITENGIRLGLSQSDLEGVGGPGLLAENCPAVSFVMRAA